MSTSIALVTCAAVSSERRMCSAMPRRIADTGSSVSPGRTSVGATCAGAGFGGGAGGVAGGAGTGVGGAGSGAACGCGGGGGGAGGALGGGGGGRGRRRLGCRLRLRGRRLFGRSRRHRGCGGRRRRLGRGWRPCLDEVEDVLLRDATAAAGAGDLRGVDMVLGGDARDDRRDECAVAAGFARL